MTTKSSVSKKWQANPGQCPVCDSPAFPVDRDMDETSAGETYLCQGEEAHEFEVQFEFSGIELL